MKLEKKNSFEYLQYFSSKMQFFQWLQKIRYMMKIKNDFMSEWAANERENVRPISQQTMSEMRLRTSKVIHMPLLFVYKLLYVA